MWATKNDASLARVTFRTLWTPLLAYFLLTLVLTYPLVLNFATHVAGDGGDDPALAWNLWWVPFSIFNLGASPIYTDYMFFPIGLNLGFYTLTYLNAFLAIPFQFAFGVIPAANINLILSFTLSGFGAYLLVIYLLNRTQRNAEESGNETNPRSLRLSASNLFFAAFAAGLVYAFSANKFLYASLGQFNIASSQWIPFYILFLLKIFDTPKPPLRYGFLLGFFLLAQALSEFIFASFLILFSIVYVIYWFIAKRFSIRHSQFQIRNLLIASLVFILPMLPIFAALFADTVSEGDFIQQGLGFSNIFSADLLGFFIPSHLHPLFGSLASRFSFPYINFMYLGFVALAFAIIAAIKIKSARIWGVWFVLFALISLGPTLRINGAEFDLPMPFDALLEIPLIKGNRYPSRWSVMLTLSLAVLVGYGIFWMLRKVASSKYQVARPLILATCYLLLVFEPLSTPLPISNLQSPSIYFQIARDAGNFSVMEIPLAWRNGFRVTGSYRADSQAPIDRSFMYAQFFQTTQQHPILNGNTSRNPELKFQYFFEAPVLNSLIAIQTGHEIDEATRTRDKELAPHVLQFFGTRYIIWHTPFEEANRDVANKTRSYIEEIFPVTKISESYENGRGVVAYRVNGVSLPNSIKIEWIDSNGNSDFGKIYLGEGWAFTADHLFWANRREAKIFAPFDSNGQDAILQLYATLPPTLKQQSARVIVNGDAVGDFMVQDCPQCGQGIVIPAKYLRTGMNEIVLQFGETVPASQVHFGNYLFSGCCFFGFNLLVASASEEQGDFAHVYVNGQDVSPNQRGYNIVVLDPKTGKVEAAEAFDTFSSEEESERLVEFIEQIPDNKAVAVAVKDEASMHLTEAAVRALQSLGSRQDLRGKFRWSHAFVGLKGARVLELEAASEYRPIRLRAGIGTSEPNLALGIDSITLCPLDNGGAACP